MAEHVSDLAVGVLDADWRVERVSTDIESLLAQSPADVIGSSFVHLVHDDDVPAFLSAVARSLVDRAGSAPGSGSATKQRVGSPHRSSSPP